MNTAYSYHIYNTAFSAGLKPEEDLTVSEWAERNRILTSKASAEPGPWRTSRVPYMKEIMDCLSPKNPIQKVVFMKGSQVAATEGGTNWVGCVMDIAPGPMMMVLPNEKLAERASKVRIAPLIETTESLRRKVRESESGSNTVMTKEFPGGVLIMVTAKSSANLRMMPCRYVFLDEVDDYPYDVKGQGDPVDLAIARTRTFSSRKKIYICSSPTIKNHSRIEREFLQTDQRRYYVPCPYCNEMQILQFAQLRYEKNSAGNIESVFYICANCNKPIDESHKTWMLENGEWRVENPDGDPKAAGFHLNALYSPVGWLSWMEVVTMWELAQKDVDKLKVFVNTILGETWEDRGEAPEWERIYRRREKYKIGTVPAGGLFLTAGADVQKDRIEVEVVAWGREKQSWSVTYEVIPGDTSTMEPWNKLEMLLDQSFPHESGLQMRIQRMGVDSGYNTNNVYQFARKYHDTLRVIATKGQESLQTPLGHPKAVELSIAGKKLSRALKLWLIGTDLLKSELYRNLRQEPPLNEGEEYPYGYCHFPQYDEEYFKMLTAEQRRPVMNRRGFQSFEWVKTRDRNEALDCRIIARAVASSLGYDRMTEKHFDLLQAQLNKNKTVNKSNESITMPAVARRRRGMRSKGIN